jgi:hypothetical protein
MPPLSFIAFVLLNTRTVEDAHLHATRRGCENSYRSSRRMTGASTVNVTLDGMPAKFAVTDRSAFIVTVQVVSETASHPLQPVNTEPKSGVAVSVTTVPLT